MLSKLKIPISDAIIDQLIAETSKNGDGLITEEEFFRWMLKMDAHHDDVEGELTAAFKIFDFDNSGTIEIEDIKYALELIGEPITDEEIKEILTIGDKDKDGCISYEEFIKLVLH
ncbi:unnamed protein product [Medioppia subpectinata]|nr:unnamed protein product [Medioppia subpectinata]CAG2100286.1 unnamed protein product [Medioppia subpectinata]